MLEVVKQMVGIAERVLPDSDGKRETLERLERGWMDALSASDAGQVQLMTADAASNDRYRTRARPTALWICVIGLGYQVLIHPMLTWWSLNYDKIPPPELPDAVLNGTLMGLLGLGALRSHDIWRGKR